VADKVAPPVSERRAAREERWRVAIQGFPPIATISLGNTTNSVAIEGYYCTETVIQLQFVCLLQHKICVAIFIFVLQQVDANAPIFRISVAFCWK
jgi:hypothetical protein